MSLNIEAIESQVLLIPLGDVEHLSDTIGKLKALGDRVREIKRLYDKAMLEYIEEHGPTTIGQTRYYAGFEHDTINNDTKATLEALFEAALGDFALVASCLCSQPFKNGACKTILAPDVYSQLFTTIEKKKTKEGKPERKVLSVNTAFAK